MRVLKCEGCAMFRQRITTSLLSHNPLYISNIRTSNEHSSSDMKLAVGLQDFEANFLRLIEKNTDGSVIEINETGTSLKFKPGLLIGGKITHDCGLSRSMGWFIEGILPLSMFCKTAMHLTLTGITNDSLDLSVDILRNVTLPLLQNFGISGTSLVVKKRGAHPKGGGHVELDLPITRNSLTPVHIIEEGLVKRIKGIAFCTKISPTIISRAIDSCRGVLNPMLGDVYIHADHYKGKEAGHSPGYSLSLVAETTTGALLSVERTANTRGASGVCDGEEDSGGRGELPEEIGQQCASMLLKEIHLGGVIDRAHQPLIIQLMVLTPEDVSKVRFGAELTTQAVQALQLIRDAFGVTFKIKQDIRTMGGEAGQEDEEDSDTDSSEEDEDEEDGGGGGRGRKKRNNSKANYDTTHKTILLSCLGLGFTNTNRRAT